MALGNTLAQAGFLKPAAAYYRKAMEDPGSPEYYEALLFSGRVEFDLSRAGEGDYAEAVRLTRMAVEWNPYRPEGYVGLAEMALFRNDAGRAAEILREGLAFCPGESILEEAAARIMERAERP